MTRAPYAPLVSRSTHPYIITLNWVRVSIMGAYNIIISALSIIVSSAMLYLYHAVLQSILWQLSCSVLLTNNDFTWLTGASHYQNQCWFIANKSKKET